MVGLEGNQSEMYLGRGDTSDTSSVSLTLQCPGSFGGHLLVK